MMNKHRMKYHLQFFAKEGPGGEKTEDATAKKLRDARKDGQVGKSTELVSALMLIGLFLALKMFIGYIGEIFLGSFKDIYITIPRFVEEGLNPQQAQALLQDNLFRILMISLPVFLVAFVIALTGNITQFKWLITTKPLQPKFNKLNPVKGIKKLFSKDKIMELLKSLMKIGVIGFVVYNELKDQVGLIPILYDMDLFEAISIIGTLIIDIGLDISIYFLIIGIIDLVYQKRKFKTDMKMTKQEIKDEYKNQEGDPHIKGQIRARMRQASQRRMMSNMPNADVVITNPTHFAIAIQYDSNNNKAPIVIAKGADYIAAKIKEAAKEHKIEIVENKPLARMLYYNVEINAEIPPELYQAVAEILAYVYSLKSN